MGVLLAAIAKMENPYVDEWVQHHLGMGIDRICLYDNNDDGYEFVGDRITRNRDKVDIIPWRDSEYKFQSRAYFHAYMEHGHDFDWMLFLDIDEFLFLHDGVPLKARLDAVSSNAVAIPWRVFTWSGIFSRDVNSPVVKDFTKFTMADSDVVKSVVRTGLKEVLEYGRIEPHIQCCVKSYSDILGNPLANANSTNSRFSEFSDFGGCRVAEVNHYWSKSLDEYINTKTGKSVRWNKNYSFINLLLRYCDERERKEVLDYVSGRS